MSTILRSSVLEGHCFEVKRFKFKRFRGTLLESEMFKRYTF